MRMARGLLRQNGFFLSVYKIEHFYSMGQGFSQGKIYSMQYVSICSQMPDLKSKKPIRMDELFNHFGCAGISNSFQYISVRRGCIRYRRSHRKEC